MHIHRTIQPSLSEDLKKKIVLLCGPRQCGKTTLSRQIEKSFEYLNYDSEEDRKMILEKNWDRRKKLLILDEIHKMKDWKRWLKGIFDKEGLTPKILVTGSARMDTLKKVGDSLAGRHFTHQLFPFDLKELKGSAPIQDIYHGLIHHSGFPEPYLEGTSRFYTKWKKSHLDLILRQDLIDLEALRDISSIETMTLLLQGRTSSPLSYASLAKDLQRDPKTIKHWLEVLENFYIFFRVFPYHKNIARSIVKDSKVYFYDTARVEGNEGIKLENLVALSLKKEVHYLNETLGIESELYHLRLKNRVKIDFLITRKNMPALLIEVKLSDDRPSPHFHKFSPYFPKCHQIQLVKNLKREKTTESGIHILDALEWITHMDLSKA